MTGIPNLVPAIVALAIGFFNDLSFYFSCFFVPVMANWLMKAHPKEHPSMYRRRSGV
jgi:hypothetical protein